MNNSIVKKRLNKISKEGKQNFSEKIVKKIEELISKSKLISYQNKIEKEKIFKIIGLKKTVESFYAELIFTEILFLIVGIALSFVLSIFIPVTIAICIFYYFYSVKNIQTIFKKKCREIEKELPFFAEFVSDSLKDSRDIFGIFKAYSVNPNTEFKKEIEITVNDISSSGIENGLIQLERRIGITDLTNIVRTVLGIVRGDTDSAFLGILSHEMKQKRLAEAKLDALKRPGKMRKYCLFLLLCFVAQYFIIFGVYLIRMIGKVF